MLKKTDSFFLPYNSAVIGHLEGEEIRFLFLFFFFWNLFLGSFFGMLWPKESSSLKYYLSFLIHAQPNFLAFLFISAISILPSKVLLAVSQVECLLSLPSTGLFCSCLISFNKPFKIIAALLASAAHVLKSLQHSLQ